MQSNIEKPALSILPDIRKPAHRTRLELSVRCYNSQPAGALRNEETAVGKKGKAPGVLKAARQRDDAKRMLLRGYRFGRQRLLAWPQGEPGKSAGERHDAKAPHATQCAIHAEPVLVPRATC